MGTASWMSPVLGEKSSRKNLLYPPEFWMAESTSWEFMEGQRMTAARCHRDSFSHADRKDLDTQERVAKPWALRCPPCSRR